MGNAQAQGAKPDTVTVATVEWIEQFDPGVLASGPGTNYKGSMFDNVIGAGAGGTLSKASGVVDEWSVSPDATKITLRLRKGIKWHDGSEATADDLAFTLTRFAADDSTASARPTARKIANLEVVDRYSLRVTLKEPDSVFIYGPLSPRRRHAVHQEGRVPEDREGLGAGRPRKADRNGAVPLRPAQAG
jgi:peptide/nickel transport system substrate-binding protein